MFLDKNKTSIEYSLTKSNRKTISIIIEKNGEVRVLAPKRLDAKSINTFVMEKEPWIREKLNMIDKNRKTKPKVFDGATIALLGKSYTMIFRQVISKKSEGLVINDTSIVFSYAGEHVDSMALKFEKNLKEIARQVIEKRVETYSIKMGVTPKKVSIKDQKKRWGTCTSKGHILFNWRLIFAPLPIIDYVVIHEIAHLKHMDHSVNFWNFVSQYEANFRMKRDWLKHNGGFIDWSFNGEDIILERK
ncbi:M48 family metallopeptidase [Fusibacter bizertensis]